MKESFNAIKNISENRGLLKQLVRRSIRMKYQSSAMGLAWVFITPLVLMCIYTFVFSIVFEARWVGIEESSLTSFALILMCGLSIYNMFSDSISTSTVVIFRNPNYVKKVVFPLELLPLSATITSLFFCLIWFLIVFVCVALLMQRVCVTAICLPLILAPLSLFTCGLAWFVASLGVYLRDMQHIVTIVLRMVFYLTGIFYPIARVPEPYRYFLYINPLAHFSIQSRKVLIFNEWPDWWILGGLTLFSVVFAQLGYIWFMKSKKGFADVL